MFLAEFLSQLFQHGKVLPLSCLWNRLGRGTCPQTLQVLGISERSGTTAISMEGLWFCSSSGSSVQPCSLAMWLQLLFLTGASFPENLLRANGGWGASIPGPTASTHFWPGHSAMLPTSVDQKGLERKFSTGICDFIKTRRFHRNISIWMTFFHRKCHAKMNHFSFLVSF